jgi:hypothetical protein
MHEPVGDQLPEMEDRDRPAPAREILPEAPQRKLAIQLAACGALQQINHEVDDDEGLRDARHREHVCKFGRMPVINEGRPNRRTGDIAPLAGISKGLLMSARASIPKLKGAPLRLTSAPWQSARHSGPAIIPCSASSCSASAQPATCML